MRSFAYHCIAVVALIAAGFVSAFQFTDAVAAEYRTGDIVITQPWSRATPSAAKVGAGYLTITNTGSAADRLIAVEAPFSAKGEVHQMEMSNGVMKMSAVEGGLEIPPGGAVTLKPGSYHLMFMGLSEPLVEGEHRTVTLTFRNAGPIKVMFAVEAIGAEMPGMASHSGHSGHTME